MFATKVMGNAVRLEACKNVGVYVVLIWVIFIAKIGDPNMDPKILCPYYGDSQARDPPILGKPPHWRHVNPKP